MMETAARTVLDALGVEGVSVSLVAGLLLVYVYASKASTVGGLAVGGASRAAHDAKIVVVVLLALVLLGVVSVDTAQASTYVDRAARVDWMELARRFGGAF